VLIHGTSHATADAFATTQACIRSQRGVVASAYCVGGASTPADSLQSVLSAMLANKADVIGFARAGDTLPEHALLQALQGFSSEGVQAVYTDSECAGRPWFKPAWSKEYALATDFPLELLLIRTALVQAADATAQSTSVASLCWQALAQAQRLAEHAIVHVPRVLYCYQSPLSPVEEGARLESARAALKRIEPASRLEPLAEFQANGAHAVRRFQRVLSAKQRQTRVSLIIPTRDHAPMLERCISSLQKHTQWPQLEIIVVDNGSELATTKTYFAKLKRSGVKVMPMPGPFNFARLNNQAVAAAAGDVVGLINNDIEALHSGWLDEMLSHLLQPDVGAVGAKLLWPNGMVQHGGVLLGVGHVAGHYGNALAQADAGDHARNQVVQRVSGVTAACLLVRKQDYLAVGGMNEDLFPVAFNDVDLCLKLRRRGKAIVWTPHATLLHAESASRGHEDSPQKKRRAQREIDNLRNLWAPELLRDPYYHPSLNLDAHNAPFHALALPPRSRAPRTPALDMPAPSITKANS
jgi:GT2 family glycosyltransferase